MLRMLDEMIPAYAATGHIRERIGSGTEYVVPHNHYRARDGRWIAIACTNDRMFERLVVNAIGAPNLLAEFPSMRGVSVAATRSTPVVQGWVGSHGAREALEKLDAAEVPCGMVNSVRELFEDPRCERGRTS